MSRISKTLAKGWMRLGTRFLPFADAATKELPLAASAAAVAVSGLGRHFHRAAERHAQSRDDHRARRLDAAGLTDGLAAAGVRAVPRADRLQVGQPPFGAGLAPRALYLDGHAGAVRRFCNSAVCAAGAFRHRRNIRQFTDSSAPRWPSCWSALACILPRPPVLRWRPIWRRRSRGRAWSRSCM